MVEILFYPFATILLLFFFGAGLTVIILPNPLKKYSLWLTPWVFIIVTIFILVLFSLFGLSVSQVSPFIIFIFIALSVYIFFRKKQRYIFSFKEDSLLIIFVVMSIILNLSPLLRRYQFLTTVSMGNNDLIVYAASSDFLVNHSIQDNYFVSTQDSIGGLLVTSYRWGTPIIESFFLNIFGLKGYQYTYIFQVVLYAISIPLAYILFQLIYKKSLIALIFLCTLFVFNANMLYMVYHGFVGQILFLGIGLYIFILIFSYFGNKKYLSSKVNEYDIMTGLGISVLYMSYHEPVVFILAPLIIYTALLFISRKDWKTTAHGLMKLGFVIFLLSSSVVIVSTTNDFIQAFGVDPNAVIGWELFRQSIPFANPWEMMGFHSIHNSAPLPLPLAIILSILVVVVIFFGLVRSKYKLLSWSYIFFITVSLIWLMNNFFAYNRSVTYNLSILLILFTIGITELIIRYKKLAYIAIPSFLLVVYSGLLLNKRFLNNHLVIDKNLISLQEVPTDKIKEPIYNEQHINPQMPFWRTIWTNYFIYPAIIDKDQKLVLLNDVYANPVPDNKLVLISKAGPVIPTKVLLRDIVWENEYYTLGRICNASYCLLANADKLSSVSFDGLGYEDSLLINGWSTKEKGARWISAKEATARLVAGNNSVDTFTIEALTLREPQRMSLYINNEFTGTREIKTEWDVYSFEIPQKQNEVLHIKLTFEKMYNPATLGISRDTRDLAAQVKRITIE